MIYIDGLGYVDESIYNVNNSANTSASTDFDCLLAEASAKQVNSSKTYNLEDIFKEASEKYNVSLDLLKAIGYNESGFQADATSSAGAMGIMQLMPATAESLGVTDAYDPYQNIMGAAKLLSQLSDMYDGNQTLMIAAYNAGSGNVAKYGGIPPFKETQNYVAKVLSSIQSGVTVPGETVTVGTANTENAANTTDNNASSTADSSASEITDSFYTSSNLDDIFSYSDYQLLMSFFENMLEIISSIGDTDDDSDSSSSSNDSLLDLYKLSNSSITYNSSIIDLF